MTLYSELESTGLVTLSSVKPEVEFAFRHALVQDVVYSSLTHRDRRELHRLVGDVLEELYAARAEELAPTLARHFLEAGDPARALPYFIQAGKAAQRMYANSEAAMFYRQALDIARAGPAGSCAGEWVVDGLSMADLCVRQGRVLELAGRFADAAAHYAEMEQYAVRCGDERLELAALTSRAVIQAIPTDVNNLEEARGLAERAALLARRLGDRAAESRILWAMLLINYFSENLEGAQSSGEQSLALARELNLREQMGYTLNDLSSFIYMGTGELEKSLAASQEAQGIWRELGNLPMLTDSLSQEALTYFLRGDFSRSLETGDEAYRIADSIANLWGKSYSLATTGFTMIMLARYHQALEYFDRAIEYGKQGGFAASQVIVRSMRVYIYGLLGNYQNGLELARLAVEQVKSGMLLSWIPHTLGSMAIIQARLGDVDGAEQSIQRALSLNFTDDVYLFSPSFLSANVELYLAREQYQQAIDYLQDHIEFYRAHHFHPYLAITLLYRAKALAGLGRLDEAVKMMQDSLEEARHHQIPYIELQAASALFDLEQRRGERKAARAWKRLARQIAGQIVENLAEEEELKASFLALPEVKRVMG